MLKYELNTNEQKSASYLEYFVVKWSAVAFRALFSLFRVARSNVEQLGPHSSHLLVCVLRLVESVSHAESAGVGGPCGECINGVRGWSEHSEADEERAAGESRGEREERESSREKEED